MTQLEGAFYDDMLYTGSVTDEIRTYSLLWIIMILIGFIIIHFSKRIISIAFMRDSYEKSKSIKN